MTVNPNCSEATAFLDDHLEIQEIDILLLDGNGVMRGKRIQRQSLLSLYEHGVCLPGSIFGADICGNTIEETGLGFDEGDADRICWPIEGTLSPVPWEPTRGQVLTTMRELDGTPFFAEPRNVLLQVLQRFQETELTPVVAVELEFYLIERKRTAAGGPRPPVSRSTGQQLQQTQAYSISDLDEYGDLLAEIAAACRLQDIPAYTAVAEYAPGQFEVNLKHRPDAVSACDDAVSLKRLIRAQARKHGLDATFMAKPYPERSGSGTHVHVSLLDSKGRNVFSDPGDPGPQLRHALGGLMETMEESMAVFAPNANSFRRFQPGSYVPMAPTWARNNRTVALRIPAGPDEAKRIEHRLAGADANPYLVVAAVLAGIHWGLTQQREPGPETTGNAEDQTESSLPLEWMAALEAMDTGEIMLDYLGSDFCHVFLETRSAERRRFLQAITPLEHQWYMDTV